MNTIAAHRNSADVPPAGDVEVAEVRRCARHVKELGLERRKVRASISDARREMKRLGRALEAAAGEGGDVAQLKRQEQRARRRESRAHREFAELDAEALRADIALIDAKVAALSPIRERYAQSYLAVARVALEHLVRLEAFHRVEHRLGTARENAVRRLDELLGVDWLDRVTRRRSALDASPVRRIARETRLPDGYGARWLYHGLSTARPLHIPRSAVAACESDLEERRAALVDQLLALVNQ